MSDPCPFFQAGARNIHYASTIPLAELVRRIPRNWNLVVHVTKQTPKENVLLLVQNPEPDHIIFSKDFWESPCAMFICINSSKCMESISPKHRGDTQVVSFHLKRHVLPHISPPFYARKDIDVV